MAILFLVYITQNLQKEQTKSLKIYYCYFLQKALYKCVSYSGYNGEETMFIFVPNY